MCCIKASLAAKGDEEATLRTHFEAKLKQLEDARGGLVARLETQASAHSKEVGRLEKENHTQAEESSRRKDLMEKLKAQLSRERAERTAMSDKVLVLDQSLADANAKVEALTQDQHRKDLNFAELQRAQVIASGELTHSIEVM